MSDSIVKLGYLWWTKIKRDTRKMQMLTKMPMSKTAVSCTWQSYPITGHWVRVSYNRFLFDLTSLVISLQINSNILISKKKRKFFFFYNYIHSNQPYFNTLTCFSLLASTYLPAETIQVWSWAKLASPELKTCLPLCLERKRRMKEQKKGEKGH